MAVGRMSDSGVPVAAVHGILQELRMSTRVHAWHRSAFREIPERSTPSGRFGVPSGSVLGGRLRPVEREVGCGLAARFLRRRADAIIMPAPASPHPPAAADLPRPWPWGEGA